MLDLIAAMADNGIIGNKGQIPWRSKEDMQYFKRKTMGRCCLVARKTWESIPKGLPGRSIVVLSRSGYPGSYQNLDDGIQAARTISAEPPMVIGGAQLYEQALPLVTRMYLTFVQQSVEGDTHFPSVDWDQWQLVSEELVTGLRFTEWQRRA